MGRTSDRLGNRRHPLFPHAKELVAAAANFTADQGVAQLVDVLDTKMGTLPADGFEQAIGMAYLELRQRRDADAAIQLLVSTARDVSEGYEREVDGLTMNLFGLVLQISGDSDAASQELSQVQAEAATHAMDRHRLLAEEAQVTLLPRLLRPRQSNGLLAGDVYAVSRALGSGNASAAMQCVDRRQPPASSDDAAARSPGASQTLVLVGVAGRRDGELFPLPTETAALLQSEEPSDLQPLGYAFTPDHVMEELQRKLAAFTADLGSALGIQGVQAVQPAVGFSQASSHAMHVERTEAAKAALTQLAQQHGDGSLASLEVGEPISSSSAFELPVHRSSTGKLVGSLRWPQARYECGFRRSCTACPTT